MSVAFRPERIVAAQRVGDGAADWIINDIQIANVNAFAHRPMHHVRARENVLGDAVVEAQRAFLGERLPDGFHAALHGPLREYEYSAMKLQAAVSSPDDVANNSNEIVLPEGIGGVIRDE